MRSAIRTAPAACWAFWLDRFLMLTARHPSAAGRLLDALEQSAPSACPSVQEWQASAALLRAEGLLEQPPWADVAGGSAAAPQSREEAEPGEVRRGWQKSAADARELHALEHAIRPALSRSERALLRSQSGPYAGRVFSVLPTTPETQLPSAEMKVLLRRRLRLPLHLAPRRCRCGGCLDQRGDHRAACATCGILQNQARRWKLPLRGSAGRQGVESPRMCG